MSTVSVGSGLGAQAVAKAQSVWNGTFMSSGQTTLLWKSAKLTFDPHIVNGGPYLNSGQLAALASARVLTWTDAKVTLSGDLCDTASARQLICALGTSATLSQIGTTTAYGIGGSGGTGGTAGGANIGAPDTNNTWTDLQIGIPTTDGVVNPFSFHSGVVQKAEWVFDRTGLVTYSYDYQFSQVETSTGLLTATPSVTPVPFSMATSTAGTGGSCIALGTYGSEAVIDGVKKATLTIERDLATSQDRIYLGSQFQSSPVTAGYVKVTWSLECDYTPNAQADLFALLTSGAAVPSFFAQAVGGAIGSSGYNKTFKLTTPAAYVDSGGEPNPDGPKIVGNQIMMSAHIDAANDPFLKCIFITPDTSA